MKLRANKNGSGKIGNYTISIGANEAKSLNLINEDGTSKELKKIIDLKNNQIIFKEENEMENIKLEKALVQYDEKGNYVSTINSKIIDFDDEEKAREYIANSIEKDVEYYLYESQEDVNNNNHYDVIICNNLKKTLSAENHKINTTIYVYDEFENQEEFFDINFDGLEFDAEEDLEDYIEEKISDKLQFILKKIDKENIENVIEDIAISHNNLIK